MKRWRFWQALFLAAAVGLVGCGGGGGGGGGDDPPPVNRSPAITSGAAASVAENTTAVLTVAATDADGDTLAYAISGGADQARFSIDAATGALRFVAAPDYETPTDADANNAYVVEVTVSDGHLGTASKTFTVTVTDVPEVNAIQGVAAAGAPIVGTVTIKDSSTPKKEKSAVIEADGQYAIDVTGMTGPFALRADGHIGGREYHLYSAATEADVGGTINVTPFTDLIVANLAQDIAANYYESGDYAALTKTDLDAKVTALKEKLQPLMSAVGLGTSIDLLRTAFSADHTGLDGLLDVVQVTVDPTTLTAEIANVVTQTTVSVDVTTGAYSGAFTAADGTGTAAGLTELQKIVAGFDTFSSLFANGLPSESNPTLLGLFDEATFLHDGANLAQFLSEPTTNPMLVGIQFTNVNVVSLDLANDTGVVGFDVVMQGVVQMDAPNRFKMIRKDGTWLMQGNQRIAYTGVEVVAYNFLESTFNPIQSGLNLEIRDEGHYRNASDKGIDYAVVVGPGLPENGVVLINDLASDHFSIIDPATYPTNYYPGQNYVQLSDAAVASIPENGAKYVVMLRNANGTPLSPDDDIELDRYVVPLRARPYAPSALSAANFPTVTAPTLSAWQAFNGGTVNVAWTIPAGCYSDYLYAYLSGPEGSVEEEKQPGPAATSASLTLPSPVVTAEGTPITVQYRGLNVSAMDAGGRSFTTVLSGN